MKKTALWLMVALCSAVAFAGCSGDDTSSEEKDSGVTSDGGGDGDGDGDTDGGASVACGSATCTATSDDTAWGGEACCFDKAKNTCGIKSDAPKVDDGMGGYTLLSDVLKMFAALPVDLGFTIVNDSPKIECLPKDAPGKPNDACEALVFGLPDFGGDAGTEEDAGASDVDAGMSMSVEVPGCCRDDGQCGYVDDQTGFGCVRISKSLLGQALGKEDVTCSN